MRECIFKSLEMIFRDPLSVEELAGQACLKADFMSHSY